MQIIIRRATHEEAEPLLQLTQAAFASHAAVLDPPSSVFRETVAEQLADIDLDVLRGGARLRSGKLAAHCGHEQTNKPHRSDSPLHVRAPST